MSKKTKNSKCDAVINSRKRTKGFKLKLSEIVSDVDAYTRNYNF